MRGEKGFALVIALIVTALLVALLVEFVNEVYVDTSHSHNFVAAQQAGILAESGIAGGIKLLQASSAMRRLNGNENYSSLLEPWAKPQSFDAGEGTVSISIEEESGKIDLNSATSRTGTPDEFNQRALLRLFDNLKLPRDLYEPLADWVDSDETPRPNGAEGRSFYGNRKPPCQPHNDKLDTLEELALVKGFTPEAISRLRPHVTVYGSVSGVAAPININTAPREVLASLHDDMARGGLVEQVLEYRRTKVIKTLSDVPGMGTLAQALALKVVTKGSVYRIRAEGKVGESVSVAEAVVKDIELAKPTVLYWRQY